MQSHLLLVACTNANVTSPHECLSSLFLPTPVSVSRTLHPNAIWKFAKRGPLFKSSIYIKRQRVRLKVINKNGWTSFNEFSFFFFSHIICQFLSRFRGGGGVQRNNLNYRARITTFGFDSKHLMTSMNCKCANFRRYAVLYIRPRTWWIFPQFPLHL